MVSMVQKAGRRIMKSVKYDKILILSIFVEDVIKFGRVFHDLYRFFLTLVLSK